MSAKPKRVRQASRRHPLSAATGNRQALAGKPVPMVCPDRHGPLFELKEGKLVKFHCIVGHSFSPVSLSDAHADAMERALWIAIRTLKEKLTLQYALATRHPNAEEKDLAGRIAEDAKAIEQDIQLLQQIQERI